MTEPKWLSKRVVLASHAKQIVLHGGPHGVRDEGLLESALARPQHLHAYGTPDLAELAAAYAFGLARNHAFVDGNKRTSFVACLTFLLRNGVRLRAPDDEKSAFGLPLLMVLSRNTRLQAGYAQKFPSSPGRQARPIRPVVPSNFTSAASSMFFQ